MSQAVATSNEVKAPFSGTKGYNFREINWDHSEKGKKPFHVFSFKGITFFIAAEFDDPEHVTKAFCKVFSKAHPRLRKNLRSVCIPFDFYGDETREPTDEGSVPAGASLSGLGFLYIFGKNPFPKEGNQPISTLIMNHELAHLASDHLDDKKYHGGPSKEILGQWRIAQQKDAKLHATLPRLAAHEKKFLTPDSGFLKRSFIYRGLAFNSHSIEYPLHSDTFKHEDWCEAVSFYILDQQFGSMTKDLVMRFEDYYPHRVAIIKQYLQS